MEEQMSAEPDNRLSDEQLADLARLVDGTLPPERRAEVEARVAASPELAQMVASQAAALEALRGTAEIGAPARLRAEVDRRRAPARTKRARGGGWSLRGALAAGTAAVLALALVLPGALSGSLSVAEAADLSRQPPTAGAPAGVAGTPQLLQESVDGVPFPDYAAKFGWKAVGARKDHKDGRDATTVYYEKDGRTIAYTIVSGDALDHPSGARTQTRSGVEYRTLRSDGRTIVTWERNGRTCVLSATSAPGSELVSLADWRGKGAIPF
jgi:anti-sigma factor RsiW